MLLSIEKNFIFVHVPKAAGSSITRALRPWCVKPKRTQWRRLLSHLPVREAPEKAFFRQHDKADWLRRKLSPEVYENACKFCVVRNPFDLAVSNYHHLRRKASRRRHRQALGWDFKAFLRYLERKNRFVHVDQTSWIVDAKGNLIVDEILRFETLGADFARLAAKLGLPADLTLPHINTSEHHGYRKYYDDEARMIAGRIYARDLKRFGYAF